MIIFNYLLMCLIFGTTFLAIKIGVDASAPPFLSAGLRFFTAGLVLFIWMLVRGKASLSVLFRKEMPLTGIGLTFGTFAALYWAEQFVSSGIAAVLSATGPLMILVLQSVVLKRKTTSSSLWGCILGFAGVVLIQIWWLAGSLAIMAGELFYSSGALYSKQVIERFPGTSPIALNAAQMIWGGFLLLLLSFFTESYEIKSLLSVNVIGSLLYLIIIGSMVGHSLFYWLVAKTNPVFPSTWLYVSPLIALTVGVLFYHELITWTMAIGGSAIIAGTFIANWESIRQRLRKPRPVPELLLGQAGEER